MPIEYQYDPERARVNVMGTGVIGLEEMLAHIATVFSDPVFRPGTHTLFDLSAAELVSFDAQQLQRILGAIEGNPEFLVPGTRWAILAPHDLDFAVSRMFEGLSGHLPVAIHVFRDEKQAEDWLDQADAPEST